MSIHLVLLTLSCCALAAAAAGGQLAGVTEDSLRARQMALLVSAALVAGNAACLLPDTPTWYSLALVALTCAGLVWIAVSAVTARYGARRHARPAGSGRPTADGRPTVDDRPTVADQPLVADRPTVADQPFVADRPIVIIGTAQRSASDAAQPASRPHFAVLPGGLATAPAVDARYPVVEATPVASPQEGVEWNAELLAAYLSERSLVTRADLDTIGSRGARAQNVGIARRIGSYAPEAAKRRAAGSAFRQRAHALDGTVLRAQLRSAYEDAPSVRAPGTQT